MAEDWEITDFNLKFSGNSVLIFCVKDTRAMRNYEFAVNMFSVPNENLF